MKLLVALGGNALIQRGQPLEAEVQMENILGAAKVLQEFSKSHKIALCHGNGPQVGLLSLMSNNYKEVAPYPLDVLVAETQGMIGYMLLNALHNQGVKSAVGIISQVEVEAKDPSFSNPTKPIGPVYDYEASLKIAQEKGWVMAPDEKYYRRVVASPAPQKIVELQAIRELLDLGHLVIFCGGGGIPVAKDQQTGALQGKEAVIDKDLAASLAAVELEMDRFLILTDVDAIYVDWGTENQRAIKEISPEELRKMAFAKGSMGPKVQAACNFAEKTGQGAIIGNLFQGEALLTGASGTLIKSNVTETIYY